MSAPATHEMRAGRLPSAGTRRHSGASHHDADARLRNDVFRKYYMENDIFLSSEGILKVISIIGCLLSSVLYLVSGWCAGPGLGTGGAVAALAAAAALALLYTGVALRLPLLAPQAWLYADIIISSVAGVLLLLTGVLSVTVCELSGFFDYTHGPLAMATAGMVTGSAGLTYAAAMRRWDAAAGPAHEPPAPAPPSDLDV